MKVHTCTYSSPHLNLLATDYWFCMSIIIKCCELHVYVTKGRLPCFGDIILRSKRACTCTCTCTILVCLGLVHVHVQCTCSFNIFTPHLYVPLGEYYTV
jgi:hypothetical protein